MKRWSRRALVYIALIAAEVFALFPFWWMITTSLKHQVEIFGGLEFLPQAPTLDNFAALFDRYNFGPFLANSVLVGAFSVAGSLLLGTPAAYALTRMNWARDRPSFWTTVSSEWTQSAVSSGSRSGSCCLKSPKWSNI